MCVASRYTCGMSRNTTPLSRARPGEVPLLVGLLLLPVLVAYGVMAKFSLNVPFIDDYPTMMDFAARYEALPTAGARLHYILADQYTEYKLVFIHVFTAAQLAVVPHLSFTFTFWTGQLCLLGMLFLLWKSYFQWETELRRRLLLFLPVAFVLFSLNYGEALDWVACCIGYLMTMTLSLLALYLLASEDRRAWRLACACVAALLACTIAANAFLLGPLGLVALLPRRRFGAAVLWCAAFLLALVPYAVYYKPEMHSGSGSYGLIPVWFVSFLGAASPVHEAAIAAGLGVLVVYFAALRGGFYRTHPAAVLETTWLLGSAALAAIGRGRTGLEFSTVSRYKIYSDLFFIFCYGFLAWRVAHGRLPWTAQRRLLGVAVAGAALFCVLGDMQGYRILRGRHLMVVNAYRRYAEAPRVNSPMYFGDAKADGFFESYEIRARDETNAAVAAGLYLPPR